ncbi:toll/interleukin-1 receptor domain-containing protein [Bacteroides sp.]|uniref:toll/interleukin-1 receptor domain-containing protein n=1 Tax=Bacteroides sp. TaxID=29523 RepID=UPI00262E397F|nr:toll/interleukin-1 receptor domain-containing protein [Bacteroides sp.]
MKQDYEYYAFISYSWDDKKWAKWLQRKLESYRLPSIVRKQYPDIPKKLKIFRDGTDIRIGTSLQQILHEELEKSKYLIVVCSPHSAQSDWVGKEIEEFIAMGKKEQIILFIIDGIPYSNHIQTECCHSVIKKHFPEILGANIHEEGNENVLIKREKAFIRVIAGMLNLSFDSLWNRYRRNFIQKVISYGILALSLIFALVLIWFINQPFDAQVKVYETTDHNANLPFEGGNITLIIEKETIMHSITDYKQTVYFNNIAGKYRKHNYHILFTMPGYENIDTVMQLLPNMNINIRRNNAYSKVRGYIKNLKTDKVLEDVTVYIENQTTKTNKNGYFELCIPVALQKRRYKTILKWKNKTYQIPRDTYPTLNDEIRINTLYIE